MPTLKVIRTTMGLTQKQLGERIGVQTARVATWERGREPVPVVYRDTIARALDRTDIDWDIPRVHRPSPLQYVRYGVQGTTGLRDDQLTWMVGIPFVALRPAEELVARLNQWCARHACAGGADPVASWAIRDALVCPLDANFVCDFTGTQYAVVLVLAVPAKPPGGARHRPKSVRLVK